MEDTSALSTSKVTVEYHDPAGVFPLLSAQLKARLPLRNLHWRSATRPLRSIDSLHVDLVSASSSGDVASRPPTSASQDSVSSQGVHRNSQALDGPVDRPASFQPSLQPLPKGRRHQIPGLRRTPYLKVYLLRCDDSETYKTVSRQQVRDWIRANTPSPKESGKKASAQENHDAFEWLILHVVVPNTSAAAQPRFSGSISNSTGTAKDRSNKTKWPGGKSNTIFEKIRSDFNSSSSHALDRVAQVRIQPEDLPADRPPSAPAVTIPAWQETSSERSGAWADLIAKFKTLLLESFDLRVDQYEEDIREREAQRSLPGWNFCTFFVLKEGLARSFEGVGLVEDALVIYDELSIGLDTSIQDKADQAHDTSATTFLEYTEDMLRALRKIQDSDDVPLDIQKLMKRPVDEYNKPYREMVLQNNISVFDFRCYIFARQLSLLLRLGKSSGGAALASSGPQDARRLSLDDGFQQKKSLEAAGQVDLIALAEVCERALMFVTSGARELRRDLQLKAAEGESDAVQNFVTSWSTAVVEQILAETATAATKGTSDKVDPASALKVTRARGQTKEPGAGTSDRPARSSSLSYRPKSVVDPPYNQTNGEVVFDRAHAPAGDRSRPGDQARSGSVELASHRAELLLLERRFLEALGKPRHWASGWSAIKQRLADQNARAGTAKAETIESDQNEESSTDESEEAEPSVLGLCVPKLIEATASEGAFRRTLETLNTEVLAHYLAANQTRSAETIFGDLAVVKYDSGDYAGAAKYFERTTSAFAASKWNRVEVAMLRMQAECLKALNRKDEHVRVLLVILQKAVAAARPSSERFRAQAKPQASSSLIDPSWLDDSTVQAGSILEHLIEYSKELPYDISVPMATYFADISVDTHVEHPADGDGLALRVHFRHLLDEAFTCRAVQLKLIGTTDEQKRDLLLESSGPTRVAKGVVDCTVSTRVSTYGSYLVEKLAIRANKILFLYEPLVKAEATLPLSSTQSVVREPNEHLQMTRILCYPRSDAFEAKLRLSSSISMNEMRSIEVCCRVGSNEVDKLELRLRAASAGLRLHTSGATVAEGTVTIATVEKPRPGIIELASMPAATSFRVLVPYEIDSSIPEILVRLDAEYTTKGGVFQFFDHAKIAVELPLDVSVQDSFKPSMLLSTFSINTPDRRPLQLLSASLEGPDSLSFTGPHGSPWPRLVLPQKATHLQYIIKQKASNNGTDKGPLALSLRYQCFDEQLRAIAGHAIGHALQDSPLTSLDRLLVPYFVDHLMFHVSSRDWTQLAYQDEIGVPGFEDFGWDEVLDAVLPAQRPELVQWLEKWHAAHARLLLGNIHNLDDLRALGQVPGDREPADLSACTRQLTISVTIPTVHLNPTASLAIHGYSRSYLPTDKPWPMGEAKRATLTISHTRAWGDAGELARLAGLGAEGGAVQFAYEVACNPDIWLVGGPKRGVFAQREGGEHRFTLELLLVPLRKGDWAVPTVDVRAVRPRGGQQGAAAGKAGNDAGAEGAHTEEQDGEDISCETYYEEQFMRVLVVPEVRSTTVGLMHGEGEGTVLLDSRQLVRAEST